MGCALSRRDPTLLIGAAALARSAPESRAALAGCDANARQSTAAAVTALLIARINFPF